MNAVSDRLKAAMTALSRGDFGAARAQGEAALRAQPGNAAIMQLLGVAHCQAGEPARGADYFRRAIKHGGDTSDNRLNLAKALMALGEYDEAAALCGDPQAAGSPELQRMQADILKARGRHGEAVWTYERLVHDTPGDVESWNNLGNARHDAGDLEGALAALGQARALDERSSLVHMNIARVLLSMDRHQDACLMFEKAALLAPKDAEPLLELGLALINIDHASAALKALGTAARLNPGDTRIFVAIGLAFTDLLDVAKAEQAFRFAIKAAPRSAPGYLNLGMLLEKANRLDALDALIAQARSAGVAGADIDYLRALSLSRKGATADALDLARPIRSSAIHPAKIAEFVGQLADRLGHSEEAFAAFDDMNRTMAQSPMGLGVDRGAYQRGIDGLAAQTSSEWFAGWRRAKAPPERAAPAFLVGFPRSGTTLMDTIVMGHSATHVLEELPIIEKLAQDRGRLSRIAEMDEAEIAELRAAYFAELDTLSPPPPGALVIDKNPLSMIRIPLIHRLFPDARIILAMRHPCDVVLSCYMQNFKVTEAMASFLDLTNASRAYDRIFSYWEKCRTIFPIDVHMLRYEAMVADTEAEIRRLIAFLGLPWEDALLDHQKTAASRGHIRTPSYAQVTERIYSSASGRWTRYRDHMGEALPVLAPWAERYGYSLD